MVVDDCEGPPLWGSLLRVVIDVERTARDGGRAVETAGVGRYDGRAGRLPKTEIKSIMEIARTGPRPLEMGVSDNPSKIERN